MFRELTVLRFAHNGHPAHRKYRISALERLPLLPGGAIPILALTGGSSLTVQMPATAGKVCKIASVAAKPAAILLTFFNRA